MKILKKIIIIIAIIIITICTTTVGYFTIKGYNMYKQAIDTISIEDKIAEVKNKPNYTQLEEMPKTYVNAVISVEDHRFYKHNGIDIISIGRAMVNDIRKMSFVEGGSTITQQLAKNTYFTQEKKIERKFAEVFMSFKFEETCSKDEILELYINTSFFGDNCYTVKEASRHYFKKEPMNMTDYESIMLAGIPNAPSVYAPTSNLELAKQRQKQVLNKMIEYKYITESEANIIISKGQNSHD